MQPGFCLDTDRRNKRRRGRCDGITQGNREREGGRENGRRESSGLERARGGGRNVRGKLEDIGYTQNVLGITRDWDDEEISSLGRSMLYGCEGRGKDGRGEERREQGREDEIYRIFEIPVHSACRTRRLHFSPRKPPLSLSLSLSRSIYLSIYLLVYLLLSFSLLLSVRFLFSVFRFFFRFPVLSFSLSVSVSPLTGLSFFFVLPR